MARRRREIVPETQDDLAAGTQDDGMLRSAAPTASNDPTDQGIGIPITEPELKKVGEYLKDEIQSHLDARATQEREWRMWLEAYRPAAIRPRKNYPWRGASNVVVGLCAQYVDQVVAREMQSIFALEPHWVAQQQNRRYADAAKPLERYLEVCRTKMFDQRDAVKPFVLEGAKLGTSVLGVDWRDEQSYRYDIRARSIVPAGRKLGPFPRWIAREDVVTPFGYRNPSEMPWFAERMYFDMRQLQMLAFQKQIDNLDKIAAHADDENDLRLTRRRQKEQTDATRGDFPDAGFRTPFKVFFRYDIDNDGYPEDYVALFHMATSTFLRLRPNPYITSMRPYVVSRFIEVEGEFDGIGVCEMVKDSQDEASVVRNQRRDNAHLANTRMYKGTTTGNLPDTIRPQNGKVIKMSDPKDLQEWKLSDMRQVDAFEEQTIKQGAAERVGMNDVNNGQVTSPVGRAAATTIMALLQEGARRFDLSTAELRAALSEEGNIICELFQTHGLPAANEPGSPEAVFGDDERGMQDAALVRSVIDQSDDIRGLVKLQLNISTAAVNKEVEKQSAMQLFQTQSGYMQQGVQIAQLVANPMVPAPVREFLVKGFKGLDQSLTNVYQAFGRFDLESALMGDLMAEVANEANMQQAQQQAMAAQGVPQGPPAANGAAPPPGTPVQ